MNCFEYHFISGDIGAVCWVVDVSSVNNVHAFSAVFQRVNAYVTQPVSHCVAFIRSLARSGAVMHEHRNAPVGFEFEIVECVETSVRHCAQFPRDILLHIGCVYLCAACVIKFIAALPFDALLEPLHDFYVNVGLFFDVVCAYIPAVVVVAVYAVPVYDNSNALVLPALRYDVRKFVEVFSYLYLVTLCDYLRCLSPLPFSVQKQGVVRAAMQV